MINHPCHCQHQITFGSDKKGRVLDYRGGLNMMQRHSPCDKHMTPKWWLGNRQRAGGASVAVPSRPNNDG